MANNEDQPAIQAVSLKLPTFWPKQPEVWFTQAEAQFAIRNITADETKFNYVVASLDQDTAGRIISFLRAPPGANKYDALKAKLQSTYGLSEYERINAIIDMPALGDDKPSVLMDKMLSLLDKPPCAFVRCLFLRRLPEDIRAVLVHSKQTDCQELAKAADQLWEARQSSNNAVRGRTPSRSSQTSDQKFCFYHTRFGDKAK